MHAYQKTCLSLFALLGTTLSFSSCSSTAREGLSFDLGYRYRQQVVKRVSKIPTMFRDVPPHPDDAALSGVQRGVIEPDFVELGSRQGLVPQVGYALALNDYMRIRPGFGVEISQQIGGEDIRERNYFGAPGTVQKGPGNALTYYRVFTSFGSDNNEAVFPYLFTELTVDLSKHVEAAAGCRLHAEDLVLEQGWDRFGALSAMSSADLAHYLIATPYISLRRHEIVEKGKKSFMPAISLDLGVQAALVQEVTSVGEQMQIDNHRFPFSAGISFQFTF